MYRKAVDSMYLYLTYIVRKRERESNNTKAIETKIH